jgi:CDP-diacylglycerol---serine O-phosphatidyltransferase
MRHLKVLVSCVPNFITLLNLFMGCLSIVFAFQGKLMVAASLIFAAGMFDFFDGFAARALKAYSEMGKSLDSLADQVSFGLAPSVILYQIMILAVTRLNPAYTFENASLLEYTVTFSAFLIAAFSALRLAKFNIDERQTSSFIGVPTPANAFLIASFPFILSNSGAGKEVLLNLYVLIPLIVFLSLLLTSEIPMLSLKIKTMKWEDNKALFVLLGVSVLLFIILKVIAVPFIFCTYLITSVVDNTFKKKA